LKIISWRKSTLALASWSWDNQLSKTSPQIYNGRPVPALISSS